MSSSRVNAIRSDFFASPKLSGQFYSHQTGWGVFANQPICAGEKLVSWGGYILHEADFLKLPHNIQKLSLQVDDHLYMVEPELSPVDRINHSCNPNAGMLDAYTLIAMRDIGVGEEICYDYAMSDSSSYDEFDCYCGAIACRGRVTGKDWQNPELWQRYQGYFSPYLQSQINRLQCSKTLNR